VTFKELRKIIAEKKKEMEIEAKYYDPNYFWKGKKIVSLDQWYQNNTFLMISSMDLFAFLII
jgi:hypothetical protein